MIATQVLLNLFIGAGTLTGFWLIYLWNRNPSVVDVGWATGLTIMGLIHGAGLNASALGAVLTTALVLFWGIRLGGYLFWTRLRLGRRDNRYEPLHGGKGGSPSLRVLFHYLLQACFQAIVGIPLIFSAQTGVVCSVWVMVGLVFWFVGYGGSIVADTQLHRFRTNPANRGMVCQTGLWNYSRHPNYFFEILLWTGFAFLGLPVKLGWLGLISPLTLMFTMARITGPISEQQSLRSKPDGYRRYRETTSMIVPWFKKERSVSATHGS